ncbi:NAD(P)-binding domain-containing protein [Pseudomonas entomophila]|jgi:pyrroline-5-carboxylate reductase|uniref:NAD(P)-binding domain-containing protein n=1 Tax=Pseudomonas entomophila TaxID=312306 RepID=UPI0015E48715|nr:NAD(P)-binding domain-containing protein [Pseudomonas entomophila]MBA1192419.1 NAD(P)-binding domain-containing protein [Pseudomonas entomophila]
MNTLGILGVGELTETMVRGLRRSGYTGAIALSPRNAERAAALAEQEDCQVLASNQAVVEAADLVILGVRPDVLDTVAAQVSLREGQPLVSLLAGVNLARLQEAFPAARCLRAMLSYAAQYNATTVALCPPDDLVRRVLEPLGTLVALNDEPAFELATVAACMNGWFYFLLNDLQRWFVDQGLPQDQARALVLGNLQDCLTSVRAQPERSLEALGEAIATPGTFTAQGLAVLQAHPSALKWDAACEQVLAGLMGRQA